MPQRHHNRALPIAAVALAVLGGPLTALAARTDGDPLVFAVIVGNNDGWDVLPRLRFADDDALRYYRLALQLTEKRNVALLTELDVETWQGLQLGGKPPPPFLPPTRSKLLQVISLFKQRIAEARQQAPRRPIHFLLFFSGHGEQGYFFLKREGPRRRDAAFTGDDLQGAFSGSLATLNGLFIDACKSQSLFVPKGDAELGPDFGKLIDKVERASQQLPIGVLTSTVSDRPAGEAEDIGGGYFSHVLTSGLSGAADADSDGVVHYDELAAFVTFNTRRISGQQPWFRPPRGKLKTPLVRLGGRANLIEIPPGLGGHFIIVDAKTGAMRLEVHKSAAQWTRLIAPPGDYRVVWIRSRSSGLLAQASIAGRPVRLMREAFDASVVLGPDQVPRGEGLGAPASAQPVDAALSRFDPARSGFDQPFTPRVVATLSTAYRSGLTAQPPASASTIRASARPPASARQRLALGYGYFAPPADPSRAGQGVSVSYGHRLTHGLELGGRLGFAFSSHDQPDSGLSFEMYRVMLQAELWYGWHPGPLTLAAGTYLGWQMVLLTRETMLRCGETDCLGTALNGDAAGLRAGLLVALRAAIIGPLWLGATAGFGLQLVRQAGVDGGRRAEIFWRPMVIGQVGYAF